MNEDKISELMHAQDKDSRLLGFSLWCADKQRLFRDLYKQVSSRYYVKQFNVEYIHRDRKKKGYQEDIYAMIQRKFSHEWIHEQVFVIASLDIRIKFFYCTKIKNACSHSFINAVEHVERLKYVIEPIYEEDKSMGKIVQDTQWQAVLQRNLAWEYQHGRDVGLYQKRIVFYKLLSAVMQVHEHFLGVTPEWWKQGDDYRSTWTQILHPREYVLIAKQDELPF